MKQLLLFLLLILSFPNKSLANKTVYFAIGEADHVATKTGELVIKYPNIEKTALPIKSNSYVKQHLKLGLLPLNLAVARTPALNKINSLRKQNWIFAEVLPGPKKNLYIKNLKV